MDECIYLIEYLLKELADISESDYNRILKFIEVCKSNIKLIQLYEAYDIYLNNEIEVLLKSVDFKISEVKKLIDNKNTMLNKLPYGLVSIDNNSIMMVYNNILNELIMLKEEIKSNSKNRLNKKVEELKLAELELIDGCRRVFIEKDIEFLNFFNEALLVKSNDEYVFNEILVDKIYNLLCDSKFLEKAKKYFEGICTKEALMEERKLINIMIKYQELIKIFVRLLESTEKSKKIVEKNKEKIEEVNELYLSGNKILVIGRLLSKRKKNSYKENIKILNEDILNSVDQIKKNEEEISDILKNIEFDGLKKILNMYLESKCFTNNIGMFYDWDFSCLNTFYNKEFIRLLSYFTSFYSTDKLISCDRVSLKDFDDRLKVIDDELSKVMINSFTEEEINYFNKEEETIKNIFVLENLKTDDDSRLMISIYLLKVLFDIKNMSIDQVKKFLSKLSLNDIDVGVDLTVDMVSSYLEDFRMGIHEYIDKLNYYSNLDGLINERVVMINQNKKYYKN